MEGGKRVIGETGGWFSCFEVKDEIGVVGNNIDDSTDAMQDLGETLKALNSLVEYVKQYSETLTDIDVNTKLNLKNLIKTVETSNIISEDGLAAIAGTLVGELEDGEKNFVESLLEIAANLKTNAENVKESGDNNKVSNELIAQNLLDSSILICLFSMR